MSEDAKGRGPSPLDEAREESIQISLGNWTELRGYIAQAAEDCYALVAKDVLAFMDELQARARKPMRDALAALAGGPDA